MLYLDRISQARDLGVHSCKREAVWISLVIQMLFGLGSCTILCGVCLMIKAKLASSLQSAGSRRSKRLDAVPQLRSRGNRNDERLRQNCWHVEQNQHSLCFGT